jgi:excisionase family DNA binding protein
MESEKTVKLMSFVQARDYLGIKDSHLRSLVFKKSIPYIKVGRILRFNKLSLNDWLETYSIDEDSDIVKPSSEKTIYSSRGVEEGWGNSVRADIKHMQKKVESCEKITSDTLLAMAEQNEYIHHLETTIRHYRSLEIMRKGELNA